MAIKSGWAGQKGSTVLGFLAVKDGARTTCGTAKFELYTENTEAWEHDYSLSPQCESESC